MDGGVRDEENKLSPNRLQHLHCRPQRSGNVSYLPHLTCHTKRQTKLKSGAITPGVTLQYTQEIGILLDTRRQTPMLRKLNTVFAHAFFVVVWVCLYISTSCEAHRFCEKRERGCTQEQDSKWACRVHVRSSTSSTS